MPLLPEPTTEDLELYFFGSGAFTFSWFATSSKHFPAIVKEYDDEGWVCDVAVTEADFVRGIKLLSELLNDRTYQDLLEDMDAVDVDNAIQLAIFGKIRYA